MRRSGLTLLLLSLATPALADPPAAPAPAPAPAPATSVPVPAPTRPDAARVAAADRLVALVMPRGFMAEIMTEFLPNDDTILALLAERLGVDTTDMTREQRVRVVEERGTREDRHFRERLRIMLDVTRRVGAEIMTEMEPEMRAIMVTLIARQFSAEELDQLAGFFRTPLGQRYARSSLSMMQDPAWQEFYTTMAPRMIEMQRRLENETNAATAHLDAPPTL